MKRHPRPNANVQANNAMWQAIVDRDIARMQAALDDGADPDVQRKGRMPMHAVVDVLIDNDNADFVIGAWNALALAGSLGIKNINMISTSNLAVSLLSRDDGGLEAVWRSCPQLRRSLLYSCTFLSSHKHAGLGPEQWPGSLARVFALEGCHEMSAGWTACFGGEWHRKAFDPGVVEQLVAFDLHPARMALGEEVADRFCQNVALYDHHGVVVDEICRRHKDWLHKDGGINGHKLVEQLIKYGEDQRYFRVHALAPHLVASGAPSATRAMAKAAFGCSTTCLMEGFEADPGKALARQGFSLEKAFQQVEPNDLYVMIRGWQETHWKDTGGKTLPQNVEQAMDRVAGFGLDLRASWNAEHILGNGEWQDLAGPVEGVGLMHVWCAHGSFYHDTMGDPIAALEGFELATGPALLDVATRQMAALAVQAPFLLPKIRALNWAVSCGADLSHPGTIKAAERTLFALCPSTKPITDRQAQTWSEAVEWFIARGVQMPDLARMDELDAIDFERPFPWRERVARIKMALVEANHARMQGKTLPAAKPSAAGPRF